MAFKAFTCTLLALIIASDLAISDVGSLVNVGHRSHPGIAGIIASANQLESPGDRIVAISSHFINTPYAADSLIGSPQVTEQLVLDLTSFDCFTFLDVVEALRRSSNADDFPEKLIEVRYRDGKVDYAKRRHFFSDWVADDDTLINDVTAEVGRGRTEIVVKQLNLKSEGTYWLPEIAVSPREIVYIPCSRIDVELLSALHSGDYVGFYSERAGLDVSHTGLIVKTRDKVMLRHASSRTGVERVVDEELLSFLQGKPGLLVYRVKP